MSYIKGNQVYYAYGEHYWVDIIAITNFQENIIDLIEIGDYVNYERILDITGDYIRTTECIHNRFWLSNNIKSIVTHEQFKNIEYKVGE